jgi:hypothetical protein
VKLLEYDLALRHSETGQFRDIFLGVEAFPILSIGGWLLDDLGVTRNPERDRVERHLFLASLLLAARAHAIESIADPDSFYDHEHLALIGFCSERSADELAQVVPRASSFWREHAAISVELLEAALEDLERDRDPRIPDDHDGLVRARWSPPARLLASAVLALAGEDERASQHVTRIAPRVSAMLDELAEAFQIRWDLSAMHRDLQRGRATFPILEVARAAAIPLRPWPIPEVVLGAMVMTDSLPLILEAAIARLRSARRTAVDLDLLTFASYLGDVEAAFAERVRSAGTRAAESGSAQVLVKPSPPLVQITAPTIAKALAMAEGFLLSDLTFEESWETHREGMFGAPLVASRFPAGMILEILSRHGHPLSEPVDAFLDFTAANGFRYYDHPWSDADSDTVGVFLRLQPHATMLEEHAAALGSVLGCLERHVHASGAVPVWIIGHELPDPRRPPMVALGEGCGTVAAHLLLGLEAVAPARYADTIQRGASHLLDRIGDVGLGANVNYPPVYALGVFARLVARLGARGYVNGLAGKAAAARERLWVALGEASRAPLTPQMAALLTVASLEMGEPERLDPRWITTVLKGQRFDGGWAGEPFAAAPNRGASVTWYSSTMLTSALCYDALRRRRPGASSDRLGIA